MATAVQKPLQVIANTQKEASEDLPPVPRGDITTTLLFSRPFAGGEVPYMYIKVPPPEGVPYTNISPVPNTVTVHDLRGKESIVNLDHDSIQIVQNIPRSKEINFDDEASIKNIYYPFVEKQIKAHVPSAKRVHIFRHGIRHTKNFPVQYNPPAMIAHLDHTGPAVADRVSRHLGADAPKLLEGRYRLIHFWQSLAGTVYTCPLAIASAGTVKDEDMVRMVSHVKDDDGKRFTEDFQAPIYKDHQKWYYLSGVQEDEAILLQIFDSEAGKGGKVKKGRAPHVAFRDPRTPADAPQRWSIEVSCFVFGEED